MPPKGREIIEGEKFGRWTVIRKAESKKYLTMVLVRCDCGKERSVYYQNILKGVSNSCGCLSSELAGERAITHGEGRMKHRTVEYATWASIIARCYNEKVKRYNLYGGRGIAVCDEWRNSYETFLSDMGRRPIIEGVRFSIERKDVNGDYCKENCYWATDKIQANNTRTNHYIEHLGETKTISQWADIYETKYGTFHSRLKRSDYSMDVMIFKFYPQFLYLKEAV